MSKRICLAAPILLLGLGCSDAGVEDQSQGGGGNNNAAAGTAPMTSGGTGSTTGGNPMNVPLAGSGQALGGGDQGSFFGPDMSVEVMPPVVMGGSGGSGGSGPPGDGNTFTSTIKKGNVVGTATFTQTGEDVELVVDLTDCPDGNHQFRLHDGYSCDNESTEGKPWGLRGTGIGPDSGIACSGGKGKLTYTRSGADKTKNWTVGDHVQETDLTAHVVIVSDEKDPNSRWACGNFF
jgi:hypothetical protein